MRRANLMIGAVTAAGILAASPAGAEEPSGKQLYDLFCTQCHGVNGDGWGLNTGDIRVLPRDHTEKAEMAARTDDHLFKAIKHGGTAVNKSNLMPAWDANMTDAEIRRVVAYLRELCDCSAD
ncbi:c-type cytochrome [Ferruginivarius sediminum]|nr:cytochrome c [Ferruginivarius sediminum]